MSGNANSASSSYRVAATSSSSDIDRDARDPSSSSGGTSGTIKRPPATPMNNGQHAITQAPSSPAKAQTIKRALTIRHIEREWSVFGQLMEDNESMAQSASLRTMTLKKRASRLDVLETVASTPSISTMSTRAAGSERQAESILQRDSVVQSPVQTEFDTGGSDDDNTMSGSGNTSSESSDSESDTDYESSDAGDHPPQPESRLQGLPRWFASQNLPALPLLYRNILKCAIAYSIASLFTFVPRLSGFIGSISSDEVTPHPSAHMVATVAVYFNPAKTAGAMFEADLYCLIGLAWASFISLGSMGMFWWIERQPGLAFLADIVVIVWIGIGMTVVAFMKQWMGKPSFNTACSMTSIILFVVVVKEGGPKTLFQVACIIGIGACVSNIVCLLLWPQTAVRGLRDRTRQTLGGFANLLALLTHAFLQEGAEDSSENAGVHKQRMQQTASRHEAAFTGLQRALSEAQAELASRGRASWMRAKAYDDAVGCLQRLAQHLNGLRGGAHAGANVRRGKSAELDTGCKGKGKTSEDTKDDSDDEAEIFDELVEELGPPLKALTRVCTRTLRELRFPFTEKRRNFVAHLRPTTASVADSDFEAGDRVFHELSTNVQRALFTFESTANQAVLRIYRRSAAIAGGGIFDEGGLGSARSLEEGGTENALLTRGSSEETVFLVYYFIFTLQEFASELVALVEAISRIYALEHPRRKTFSIGTPLVQWFTNLGKRLRAKRNKPQRPEKLQRPGLTRRLSSFVAPYSSRRRHAEFPKVRPHAPNTLLTPAKTELTRLGRLGQTVWQIGGMLKEKNVRFAIKAGTATALLAAPAFFDSTRPLFVEFRGEWALISFFVVLSPTIGATNFLSLHRILGTVLGAVVAACIFELFPENPLVLSLFGFLFSIPCFYYIIAKPKYAASSRFVLLAYNLTCLYCYNIRLRDIPVFDIAYRRSTSVTIDVVYAGIVSRVWWPAEARRELANALSEFCLNVGWLYTHIVAANSGISVKLASSMAETARDAVDGVIFPSSMQPTDSSATLSETTPLLPKSAHAQIDDSIRTFMAMELHLQMKLLELQALLAQTQHEPRLKGPFPIKMYRQILTSLQTILDKLHSMRCVTTKEEWFLSVRNDFVLPVNRERREMVGNIILYFSVLSGAFKLKTPLPPYLPPAERARQSLVDAIRRLDVVRNRDVKGSRQLLFFAYALTMKGVIDELEFLGKTLQVAFGVIGQTVDEFESLFKSVTGGPQEAGQAV